MSNSIFCGKFNALNYVNVSRIQKMDCMFVNQVPSCLDCCGYIEDFLYRSKIEMVKKPGDYFVEI